MSNLKFTVQARENLMTVRNPLHRYDYPDLWAPVGACGDAGVTPGVQRTLFFKVLCPKYSGIQRVLPFSSLPSAFPAQSIFSAKAGNQIQSELKITAIIESYSQDAKDLSVFQKNILIHYYCKKKTIPSL